MKGIISSLNIFILIAIIFLLVGIVLAIFGFGSVILVIPLFAKILLFLAFVCFAMAIIFYFFKKEVNVKIEEKNKKK